MSPRQHESEGRGRFGIFRISLRRCTISGVRTVAFDFLLPTLGSAGDVIPVVCLGRGLVRRGHSATVVANEEFAERVQAAGLGFVPLGTRDEAQQLFAD